MDASKTDHSRQDHSEDQTLGQAGRPDSDAARQPTPAWGRVIFYDGTCGLCHGFVRFVLNRDPEGQFHFAALQSDFARDALAPFSVDPTELNTVYLLERNPGQETQLAMRSEAAIRVLSALGGGWRLTKAFLILPRPIRDLGYRAVAAVRYRLFGRKEACNLPSPQERARFLGT